MATPDLSLCMIIRNEERHLERCLASVQGWVSEIIIGDTGSSDGSIGIARSFGAQVIDIPWENDFAKARNLTLRAASCSWILVLDADEAIAGWRKEVLQPLLEAEKVQGYFLPFIHYVGNTSGREYVTDNVCRLFRNDARIVFEGSIHEEAAGSIWALPEGHVDYAELPIDHYGYLDDELQRKDKASRNLSLIHTALELDPKSIPLRYALGTEHYQQGQYTAAANILFPLLREIPAGSGYAADIYLKTAYALQASRRSSDAKTVFANGCSLFPDFTDLLESYAGLLLEEGELQASRLLLHQALQSGNTAHKYPSSSGSGTSRTQLFAGQVCERLFLYKEAHKHYTQAIGYKADYSAAWDELVPLCLLSGEEEILSSLTRLHAPSLSSALLGRLVPAALNARAFGWLEVLGETGQLPLHVQRLIQVLLQLLPQQHSSPQAAQLLAQLLEEDSEQPFIHGYLWAWSCRIGDEAAAGQWLERLAAYRPGLTAVRRLLVNPPADSAGCQSPSFADLSYAAQLLLQTGAWSSLLALCKHADAALLQWSRLPEPLWCGLLQAPAAIKKQWCSVYTAQEQHCHTPAGLVEWLLYAAVASSCGLTPLLEPAAERALQQSGSRAAAVGLSYHKLLLAAAVHPQGAASGSIPRLLLVRAALREKL
ncbi:MULTISPECIES: glycosyltransferase family 2 protein [Paenibacillus]|uniref:Glycosyltransferase 2-like domain-containing protein n=1 Tax=Paenibacillus borealis TaxID=160799 RepID=A0ABX3GVT9_PAEBO|nr:glycosyltransferase [Paenibacillus borealis]OMD37842.1 hypothetical protein BSK56_30850 [Paenibacillus borealis]